MFAGPNGSGKSTLKSVLPPELLGVYLNPDEIEKDIRTHGWLDLASFGVITPPEEILAFFKQAALLQKAGLTAAAECLRFREGKLLFHDVAVNSYFASVAADFLRRKLMQRKTTFTIETVMSSPDKIALLEKAQALGYRTYLYYVATEDPLINISRVRHRVKMGGHPVPEDKIVSRYHRSLELLSEAIRYSNRAYIFDNSRHERIWIAEITDGVTLELKTDSLPAWFEKAVWNPFQQSRG